MIYKIWAQDGANLLGQNWWKQNFAGARQKYLGFFGRREDFLLYIFMAQANISTFQFIVVKGYIRNYMILFTRIVWFWFLKSTYMNKMKWVFIEISFY